MDKSSIEKLLGSQRPESTSLLTPADEIAHRVRQERSSQDAKTVRGEWSYKYKVFEDWVKEEEYQEKVAAEEERKRRETDRRYAGGCSHDHSAERKLVEMSTEQKLSACEEFRREGNAWFQEGQFYRASEMFRKVIVYLDYTFPETEEQDERMKQVQLSALVNLTVCCLKFGDFNQVLEHSRQALQLDEAQVKVMYCAAKAHRHLANFEQAEELLKKACQLDGENVELIRERCYLKNSVREYKERSAERARAMFVSTSGTAVPPPSCHSHVNRSAGNQESLLASSGDRKRQSMEDSLLMERPTEALDLLMYKPEDDEFELNSQD